MIYYCSFVAGCNAILNIFNVCQNTHQILNGWYIASLVFQKPFDESDSFLHAVSLSEMDWQTLLVYSISVLAWRSACGCIVSRSFSLAGVFSCEEHLSESDFEWILSLIWRSLLLFVFSFWWILWMLNQLIALMSVHNNKNTWKKSHI